MLKIRPDELPGILPVFPLLGALLLPRSLLPIRIYEPRYVTMLEDVLGSPRMMVIAQPRQDAKKSSDQDVGKLYDTACAGRVIHFEERDDGTYTVLLKGIARVKLGRICSDNKPYLRYNLDWQGFLADLVEQRFDGFSVSVFYELAEKYFDTIDYSVPMEKVKTLDQEELINMMACVAPFSNAEKQALLEAPTLQKRTEILQILMEMACISSANDGMAG